MPSLLGSTKVRCLLLCLYSIDVSSATSHPPAYIGSPQAGQLQVGWPRPCTCISLCMLERSRS